MSRAKPLSMEEKTARVLTLLQQKDTVFNLKDLERICQKEKGVVPQSIKEVLDILISENKAKEKKVGSSKYYWSFLSDIKLQRESTLKKLYEENEKLKKAKETLSEEIEVLKKNRSTIPNRKEKLRSLVELKQTRQELDKALKSIEENDPAKLTAMKEELNALKKDLSEWADAFSILQSYVMNTYNMTQQEFCSAFSISGGDIEKIEEI